MRPARLARTALAILAIAVMAAESARAARPETLARRFDVRVASPGLARSVSIAAWGADDWLRSPACTELLDDFRDARGTPLASVLRAGGESVHTRLGRLIFYDGTKQRACRSGRAFALTQPGSLVVFVCPSFERLDLRQARALVIHEMLHSLGLGENPPTSFAITQRVLERCAR